MSRENVELYRQAFQAFNARDIEAFIALCDPDIDFHSTFAAVGGARYGGHDGLRRWHRDLEDAWGEGIHVKPQVYFDLGRQTLTFGELYGRGRQSGAEVVMPYAGLATWRDGACVSWKAYGDKQDALRELGLQEEDLEALAP
jgi:ketosteroid isomerase-like protein